PGVTTSTSSPDGSFRPGRRPRRPSARRDRGLIGVKPDKAFGQHFLVDRDVVTRIGDACAAAGAGVVVEVGPGLGALTDELAQSFPSVIGIEIDRDLAQRLAARFASDGGVRIVEADALLVDPVAILGAAALSAGYTLAGNLP